MLRAWSAPDDQGVCRVIDIHVKVDVVDAVEDGKDCFWLSMSWRLSDTIPASVDTVFSQAIMNALGK